MSRNLTENVSASKTWLPWLILAALLASFVFIVLAAPAERTLGEAIRYVYVHVGLIQAGMIGLYLAGSLGFIILISGNLKLQRWTHVVAWVGFSFFLAGGILSIVAANATWGGFPMSEPRNRAMLSVLALGLIVLILNAWIPSIRVRGLLYLLLAGYVVWTIPNAPLFLHPGDAGGTSPSRTFRLVFFLLPLNASLIAAWFVWFFTIKQDNGNQRSIQMEN